MTAYAIEPDLTLWLPVPRDFPGDVFATAEEWADDVSEQAIPDNAALRATYRRLALDVAANQFEESSHTFWYTPEDGHALGTAHLGIFDDDLELDLSQIALPQHESATPVQVESFPSAVFGEVVQSASTIASEPTGSEQLAVATAVGHIKTVGRSHGMVFVLEAYDADLSALAFMMEPMVQLFESVTFDVDSDKESAQ